MFMLFVGEMIELSRFNWHHLLMLMVCFMYQKINFCWALNEEGLALLKFRERVISDPYGALLDWNEEVGVIDPCLWFGVECANGNVVILDLKNLCLGGTIAPDLRNLVHLKSIILRNNSFFGIIPDEIGELKELGLLDLGYNNFSAPLPSDFGDNLSPTILLLDNNEFFRSMSPEIDALMLISEVQVDETQLSIAEQQRLSRYTKLNSWRTANAKRISRRRLLPDESNIPSLPFLPEPPPPPPPPSSLSLEFSPLPSPAPSPIPNLEPPSPTVFASSPSASRSSKSNSHQALILSAAIGGPALVFILAIGIYFCHSKVSAVKPWATGLSGQLQKAFVTGVPKLKRSELVAACEDFSNVIGSSSMGTVYKGTLSSGVEIAVTSLAVASAKHWPRNLETQFRKKIDQLSKVNHKNFVNLIGYCVEEEPFTRMMVFEYAPNGTLFEHLHIREAEHLDWGMRMRIAMGIAYCLEHMHQLRPPIAHKNLNSSAIHLTEDYAAKISDFGIWNELVATELGSSPESNVYSFGVILFEMITGRLPYSVDSFSLQDWASDYLRGRQSFKEMVDQNLSSFNSDQVEILGEMIKSCCHSNPKHRPSMRDITARLREVTGIGADGAVPKLSPLWWAELEIMNTEAV